MPKPIFSNEGNYPSTVSLPLDLLAGIEDISLETTSKKVQKACNERGLDIFGASFASSIKSNKTNNSTISLTTIDKSLELIDRAKEEGIVVSRQDIKDLTDPEINPIIRSFLQRALIDNIVRAQDITIMEYFERNYQKAAKTEITLGRLDYFKLEVSRGGNLIYNGCDRENQVKDIIRVRDEIYEGNPADLLHLHCLILEDIKEKGHEDVKATEYDLIIQDAIKTKNYGVIHRVRDQIVQSNKNWKNYASVNQLLIIAVYLKYLGVEKGYSVDSHALDFKYKMFEKISIGQRFSEL